MMSLTIVIVNSATMSLSLWLQMCGRGSRIFNDKNIFYVLDLKKITTDMVCGQWIGIRIKNLKEQKTKGNVCKRPVQNKQFYPLMYIMSIVVMFLKEKKTQKTQKRCGISRSKKAEYTGKKLSEQQ